MNISGRYGATNKQTSAALNQDAMEQVQPHAALLDLHFEIVYPPFSKKYLFYPLYQKFKIIKINVFRSDKTFF